MSNPYEVYDLLQDYAADPVLVDEIMIGVVWTYCRADGATGLAMSPGMGRRTLPFSGSLQGQSLAQLAPWVREFEPFQATVGMAAVNAGINRCGESRPGMLLPPPDSGRHNNLAVFEHFLPQIRGKRVVVIGRYPGLEHFVERHQLDVRVLERQVGDGDLPDTACEYLLPEAEWVFLTATSIPNKTFPRLADLSRDAVTVLMGPTTPWLPDLYHFGIDYLAGVEVDDAERLRRTVAEGGGVRLFDGGVRFRIAPLTREVTEDWTRDYIARTVSQKDALTRDMDEWYRAGNHRRFPGYDRLESVNVRLSRLDTCFKTLRDAPPQGFAD